MKATEDGLLSETTGRDLGGTFEFSLAEAMFFSHIASMQSAKAALKKKRKKNTVVDDTEGEEDIE